MLPLAGRVVIASTYHGEHSPVALLGGLSLGIWTKLDQIAWNIIRDEFDVALVDQANQARILPAVLVERKADPNDPIVQRQHLDAMDLVTNWNSRPAGTVEQLVGIVVERMTRRDARLHEPRPR